MPHCWKSHFVAPMSLCYGLGTYRVCIQSSNNVHADVSRGALRGLNVWLSYHLHLKLCMIATKVQVSLLKDPPEPLLLDNMISTKISYAGSYLALNLTLSIAGLYQ